MNYARPIARRAGIGDLIVVLEPSIMRVEKRVDVGQEHGLRR